MGIMADTLAEKLIIQAFDAVKSSGCVSFTFQGGEPTLAGLPFFRHFVETVSQHRPKRVQVHYAIQTNGIVLDDEWALFLKENRFLVGLSIDGIRSVHDSLRVDASGLGTWRKVLQTKSLLEQYGIPYNALCVVTSGCADKPEMVYKSLKNLGFRYMQFIACLDPIGHPRGQEPWSLTPECYGKFLCGIFDLWYQDWKAGNYHSIRLFDDYIHILIGDSASTCASCGKCGAYLVVEADGSCYPCDFFVLDNWKIGSLDEMSVSEMMTHEKEMEFLAWGAEKPKECAVCSYSLLCNGGCKNEWFADDCGSHNYFCASFRALFLHALPRMEEIAKAERIARKRF